MIYILTGAIRSGKTTALRYWCNNRQDVDGVLCPDNAEGRRYFLKIKSKKEFEVEVDVETEVDEVVEVGRFRFLKAAFERANAYLLSAALETTHQYLIIDELGKLELKNEGLHLVAEKLIPDYLHQDQQHLILVVRDSLLGEVLGHYGISDYSILKPEDLKGL